MPHNSNTFLSILNTSWIPFHSSRYLYKPPKSLWFPQQPSSPSNSPSYQLELLNPSPYLCQSLQSDDVVVESNAEGMRILSQAWISDVCWSENKRKVSTYRCTIHRVEVVHIGEINIWFSKLVSRQSDQTWGVHILYHLARKTVYA